MDTARIRDALAREDLDAAILIEVDPVRDFPRGRPAWDEALRQADFVLAVSMFEDASTKHADVVFPAEAYPEKDGTVTHPDGRLQRLRPGVPHPDRVRPTWQVLVELCALLGQETGLDSAEEVLEAIASEVPFYAGLTPEEIGGRGVRWQDREAAAAFPGGGGGGAPEDAGGTAGAPDADETVSSSGAPPSPAVPENGALRLGTYRDLWAAEVTDRSPALRFLVPKQVAEVAPSDAERLGLEQGDEVNVRSNGTSVRARLAVRERVRPGSVFLIEGTTEQNANALAGAEAVELERIEENGE